MAIDENGGADGRPSPHQGTNYLSVDETAVAAASSTARQDNGHAGNGGGLKETVTAASGGTAFAQQTPLDLERATLTDLWQIWKWNAVVPAAVDRCVHDMFLVRAKVQPTAPAVCAWDGNLSYAELDHLSSGLAARLITLKVAQGSFVPVCFEKSMWTTVATVGILKAGAAFVLLDPTIPELRLEAIVSQVKASIIVCSQDNEALSSRLADRVIILDSQGAKDLYNEPHKEPSTAPGPLSPMYVAFTSGSTGTPKGAIITHGNLASALFHQERDLQITEKSRVYDFSSYNFDVSICNMFATLTVGGCLCVPNEIDRQDRLAESIVSLEANTIDFTPSVSRLLRPEQVPGLQQIIFGGEALRIEHVTPWWGKVRIVSLYGPCECTPNSTINSHPTSPEEAIQMGKGIGLNTWIVDTENHNSLVPLGVVGELLLEGPLIGSGYLNEPEKTSSSFIEDPDWLLQGSTGHPGRQGRLYKTGDLVRYNKDGSLTFAGRKDEQVKIRGQRVELGEIEHVLRGHVEVTDAAVVLKYEDKHEPWIAGFVTLHDETHDGAVLQDEAQHVEVWERQFNDDYLDLKTMQPETIGRDFTGWTSMYDGRDIDKAEMNEWLDNTLDSIRNGTTPQHVLEIGTGSGMILFNLIEGLQSYTGLDPSGQAVEFIIQALRSMPTIAGNISMYKATAMDISRLGQGLSPDVVVLNSVIQYFPSLAYLYGVVEQLVQIPGVKTIFVGDVRSFSLYDEFLAARALHVTGGNASKDKLRRIMHDMKQAEGELLVDPAFFTGLSGQMPRVEHVEILPKTMHATNELSAYRYEAVIHPRYAMSSTTPLLPKRRVEEPSTHSEESPASLLADGHCNDARRERDSSNRRTQILLLCYARLMEPVAYYSIFPYIAQMTQYNGNLPESDIGFYSGLFESLFSAVQASVLIFWGYMADRVGGKTMLIYSLWGMAITSTLFGLASSLWQMALFRCLSGLVSGGNVVIRAMIGERCTPQEQTRAFAWYSFAGNIALFIGPLIGGALADPASQYPKLLGGQFVFEQFPYLLPGIAVGLLGMTGAVVVGLFIEEKELEQEATTEEAFSAGLNRLDWALMVELIQAPGVAAVLSAFVHVMLIGSAFMAVGTLALYTGVGQGGLGFSPHQIARFMAGQGAVEAVWLLLLFPLLHRRIGTKGILHLCAALFPFFFADYMGMNALLRNGSPAALLGYRVFLGAIMLLGPGMWMVITAVQLALQEKPAPVLSSQSFLL
ncbi:peramine synthetase [Purpureocillium lavendulum]|uniref:Peramine synthetase n=1 Tax=Purpureocillium lavendulum TaxID=1247861 RepID=A0AB34FGV8_9HYPO|nr:peramine synthetase [Purpureocillium lavendulum]